ncbi:MAG TPA: class I SAM-dependent methyltransferase [Streptosporangiaceae bacterium]|nr:class I SAM-dependent methyltransferase [Streptosporangiaceae bacterium]
MTEGGGWPDIAAAYDVAAATYADRFADELVGKVMDRRLLDEFALTVAGQGPVWDVGCGAAGHITRFLADQEVEVVGCDISPGVVAEARRRQPDLDFRVADLRRLPVPDGSLAGILAFYSLIHLPRPQIPVALAEFRRVLKPTGTLLLAMHSATTWSPEHGFSADDGPAGEIVETAAFGHPVELRVTLVYMAELTGMVGDAGLPSISCGERAPYPREYPTRRIWVWSGPNEPEHLNPGPWLG